MYIGWIYHGHPMITFAPTIAKVLLSKALFVTQFANVSGAVRGNIASGFCRTAVSFMSGGNKDVSDEFGTLLSGSDRIIVLSDHHKSVLARQCAAVAEKTTLIPPPPIMPIAPAAATRQRVRESLGVKPNEFLLAYLGYIYPVKGIETLLRAFHALSQRRDDTRLVLVGGLLTGDDPEHPGYKDYLLSLATDLGIADRITWTGAYDWDSFDASFYLRAADAFVLPIDTGAQLNNSSFSAAAAHGLPIVATRSFLYERPFSHRENVFFCPPKDPALMAAAIETLMDDPALRATLRRGALKIADAWFSWDKATSRILETLMGNPSRPVDDPSFDARLAEAD
jgi:glycosyltransferase involved in cell wall biosynthesis